MCCVVDVVATVDCSFHQHNFTIQQFLFCAQNSIVVKFKIQNKMFDWISPSKLFQLISPNKPKETVENTVMDPEESRMVTDLFVKPDGSPMAFVVSPNASERQQVGLVLFKLISFGFPAPYLNPYPIFDNVCILVERND